MVPFMLKLISPANLTKLNTLHLTSSATSLCHLEHTQQLPELKQLIATYPSHFIIGGGSNIILPEHYPGLIIHNRLKGIQLQVVDPEWVEASAAAGENWDDFVAFCCANQAYGLENLSLIPGSVGAAPVQNIGAYGVEIKDFLSFVEAYDLSSGNLLRLANHACHFSYRHSWFKTRPQLLITKVGFKLRRQAHLNLAYGDLKHLLPIKQRKPSAADLRAAVIAIRQTKLPDPMQLANAGSFFHNPILPSSQISLLHQIYPKLPVFATTDPELLKISAGWLIDNLGLKGYRSGELGIYAKQALVIVNYGQATQTQLLAFAQQIQAKVQQHYNIQLHIEPIILC